MVVAVAAAAAAVPFVAAVVPQGRMTGRYHGLFALLREIPFADWVKGVILLAITLFICKAIWIWGYGCPAVPPPNCGVCVCECTGAQ